MRKAVLCVLLFSVVNNLFAQTSTSVQELNDALKNGQAVLTANGNGGSSGMAVNGYLWNVTSGELRIDVYINEGLYLRNSGAGQNMVATRIYLKGGRYFSDGLRDFITLGPQENTEVNFMAFCANLERDNPSPGESFSSDPMPSDLQTIAAKINRYVDEHPDDENTAVAAQVALWRSQGKTWDEIGEHFRFTQNDWNNAGVILNYTP
jgi:hypothetical protein